MNWLAASFDAHKTELIFSFYPKFPLRNSRNRRNGVSSNRSWAVRRPPRRRATPLRAYCTIDDFTAQIPDRAPPGGGRVGRGFLLGTCAGGYDLGGELLRARPGGHRQRFGLGGSDHAYGGKPGGSTSDSPVPEHQSVYPGASGRL